MEVEHNHTNQDVTQEEQEDLSKTRNSEGIGGSKTDSETITTNLKSSGKSTKKKLSTSNNEIPLDDRRYPSRRNSKRKYTEDELNNSQVGGGERQKRKRNQKRRSSAKTNNLVTVDSVSSTNSSNSPDDSESDYHDTKSTISDEFINTKPKEISDLQKDPLNSDETNVDLNGYMTSWGGLDLIDGNSNEEIDDRNAQTNRRPVSNELWRTISLTNEKFISSTPSQRRQNKKDINRERLTASINERMAQSTEDMKSAEEENAELREKINRLERQIADNQQAGEGGRKNQKKVFKMPKMLNLPKPDARSLLLPSKVPGRIQQQMFHDYMTSEVSGFSQEVTGQITVDANTGAISGVSKELSTIMEDTRERATIVAHAQATVNKIWRLKEIDKSVDEALGEVLKGTNKTPESNLNAQEVANLINKAFKSTVIPEIHSTVFTTTAAAEECLTEIQRTQEWCAMNTGGIAANSNKISNLMAASSSSKKSNTKSLSMIRDETEKDYRMVIKGHRKIAEIKNMSGPEKKKQICEDIKFLDSDEHQIEVGQIQSVYVKVPQRNAGKGIIMVRFKNQYRGLNYQYIERLNRYFTKTKRQFETIVEYRTLSELEEERIYFELVDEVARESEKFITNEYRSYHDCTVALNGNEREVANRMMKYELKIANRKAPRGGSAGPYIQTIPKPKDGITGTKFSYYTTQVKLTLERSIASLRRMAKRKEEQRKEREENHIMQETVVLEKPTTGNGTHQ